MANVLIDTLPSWRIDPFFGGGVGLMSIKVRADGVLVNGTTDARVQDTIDDSPTRVSYQAIGGLSVRASRRLNIDVTYRYQSGPQISFLDNDTTDKLSARLRGRYETNGVTLGFRYAFGAP
jgi:opacity protein-like surface antigen